MKMNHQDTSGTNARHARHDHRRFTLHHSAGRGLALIILAGVLGLIGHAQAALTWSDTADYNSGWTAWTTWTYGWDGNTTPYVNGSDVIFNGGGGSYPAVWENQHYNVGNMSFSGKDYTIGTTPGTGYSASLTLTTGNIDVASGITATFLNNAGSGQFALHGSAGITKTGAGTLTLNLPNDVSGAITVGKLALQLDPVTLGTASYATANTYSFSPAANNLLAGRAPSANNVSASEGSGNIAVLTDGAGAAGSGQSTTVSVGNGQYVTYNLPASSYGYNISAINIFAGWDNSGRENISLADISYSTVTAPATFIPIAGSTLVDYEGGTSDAAAYLTATGGVLASNVYALRFNFGNQENGYVGYRELEAVGTPATGSSVSIAGGTLKLQSAYATSSFTIRTNSLLELNGGWDGATTTFSGVGTLRKTGAGEMVWGSGVATFTLGAGSLIDVQEGTFTGGSYGNENWNGNLSDLNVASGATFNTVEANVRVNRITGTGTIATGYGGAGYANLTVGVDNGSSTFGGVIQDAYAAGNLVKAGSGTITLSGANSYSGVTYINAGTLVAANNTALGSGGWNGGTMTWVYNGGTLALQGGISLDEHMHVFGAGGGGMGAIRSLSGNNAMTLKYNGGSSGPGLSIDSNTTVGVDADTLTLSGFYEYGGNWGLTKVGNGTLVLTEEQTYTGGTTVNGGTLQVAGNGGRGRLRDGLTVNANGMVVTTGDGSGFGYADQLSSLTINGGLVKAQDSDCHIWNIFGGVNMTGGELQSNGGGSDAGGRAFQWNRTPLTVNASANTAVISGRINLRGDNGYTVLNASVSDGAASTDLLVSAAITGSGVNLSKSGNGTMILSGNNSYSGATSIEAGTLALSGSGTLGNGALAVRNSATLNLGTTIQTLGGDLNGSGAGNGAVGTITNGTINLNGNNAFLQNGTFTMNLAGGGGSRLWIGGDGNATVELGGNNSSTYADNNSTIIGHGTTGNAGTVKLLSPTALGPSGQNAQVHSGTLDLNGQTGIPVSIIMLNNANLANNNAATPASYAGTVTFNGTTTPQIGGAGDMTLSGGLVNGGFTKSGAGALTLSGNNSYTGDTSVNGGTLAFTGGTSSLGNAFVNSGTLAFTGGTSTLGNINNSASSLTFSGNSVVTGGTLHFENFKPTLTISDHADVTLTGGITHRVSTLDPFDPYHAANYIFSGGTLRVPSIAGPSIVWDQSTASMHFDGTRIVATADNANFITTIGWDHTDIINLGAASGAIFDSDSHNIGLQVRLADDPNNPSGQGGKLTKLGAGTLTLSANNSFSGATTVSNGTLLINGTIGSGSVAVHSGATLGGNGSISGAVTVNSGGTLAPGASIGTLTLGATPTLGGTLAMEIDKTAAAADKLALGANPLTLGGALIVSQTDAGTFANGDTFTLFATNGTPGQLSGWFSSVSLPALPVGLTWDTNRVATEGVLEVYNFRTNAVQTMVALKNTPTTLKITKLTGKTENARGTVGVLSVSSATSATVGISGPDITYTPPSGFTGTDTFTAVLSDGHGYIVATVVVTVSEANVGPDITPGTTDGGLATFTASGMTNQVYTVQLSTNLPAWTDYTNVTSAPNGVINFTDSVPTSVHGNPVFYRLKQQ